VDTAGHTSSGRGTLTSDDVTHTRIALTQMDMHQSHSSKYAIERINRFVGLPEIEYFGSGGVPSPAMSYAAHLVTNLSRGIAMTGKWSRVITLVIR
jgi:hypothetical protein